MQIRKTLIALLAVAIAIAFSPVQELQAASLLSPGSQPAADNVTYTVKAKKAAKKKGKEGQERQESEEQEQGPRPLRRRQVLEEGQVRGRQLEEVRRSRGSGSLPISLCAAGACAPAVSFLG